MLGGMLSVAAIVITTLAGKDPWGEQASRERDTKRERERERLHTCEAACTMHAPHEPLAG
jgi:hypothetical protein